ncbi:MAG: Fe-S cluster assembly protein SufD [Acidisphaera sp.]|nr:Fe-S cluster assembly protein SufD [Acidisphaera sp.]
MSGRGMSAAAQREARASLAQSFLARFEGLKARLPGDARAREAAALAFGERGLPGPRDEAWKYTNLRALAGMAFHEPFTVVAGCNGLLDRLPAIAAPRLVFVDGRLRQDLSRLPGTMRVSGFAQTPDFGTLVHPEREPLAALNTMLAQDGAMISVAEGVDAGTLVLASLAADVHGRPVAFHPRHRVRLARGARLTLIEISLGEGVYLHNPVSEVLVGQGAVLTHVRLQDEAPGAFHLATLYADIAARGTYDGFALNIGARIARTEIHARLGGENAVAHLNGAQLLGGTQHADFTSVVSHEAPSCTSRQTIKNVLSGKSRGVFQGRIEVARGAQKTDGYQMNQALLLSADAEIDSKPELEIYADDVKCSHGATVGALDADQIFYLRSRGVPEPEARALLVRAFLAEALDPIADETARTCLDEAVERWWERQAA